MLGAPGREGSGLHVDDVRSAKPTLFGRRSDEPIAAADRAASRRRGSRFGGAIAAAVHGDDLVGPEQIADGKIGPKRAAEASEDRSGTGRLASEMVERRPDAVAAHAGIGEEKLLVGDPRQANAGSKRIQDFGPEEEPLSGDGDEHPGD